jgi:hypothetical protein
VLYKKCITKLGIKVSGPRSATEEVGWGGVRLGLVVKGGGEEMALYQNTSQLNTWHVELHVDGHTNTALHFTFTNSCGLFLGRQNITDLQYSS